MFLIVLIKTLNSFANTVRAKEWWGSKGPPLFGTAYATLVFLDFPSDSVWPWLLFLLFSLAAVGIYTNVINDLSDQHADRVSGKHNRMYGRSRLFKISMLSSGVLLGVLSSLILVPFPWALGLYIGMFITFTAYSLKPLRLKQRGFFGVLADAVGALLLPHLFSVVLMIYSVGMVHEVDEPLLPLWIFLIGVWSTTFGLKGILRHQIVDAKNDRAAKICTFAVAVSVSKIKIIGKWFLFPVEIASFAGILWLVNEPLPWCFLILYLLIEWLRYHCWGMSSVIFVPMKKRRLFLVEYYGLFYPLVFLFMLVQKSPQNIVLLAAHLSLFPHRLHLLSQDVWRLVKIAVKNAK